MEKDRNGKASEGTASEQDKKRLGLALARKLGGGTVLISFEEHFSGDSVLMNPIRMSLFREALKYPGSTARGLVLRAGLEPHMYRHLHHLRDKGYLGWFSEGKNTRYYVPIQISLDSVEKMYVLSNEITHRIYHAAASVQHPTLSSIAKNFPDMSPQRIHYHLMALVSRGLLEKKGREYRSTGVVEDMQEAMEKNARHVEKALMNLFKKDNLAPERIRRRKNLLWVEVRQGHRRETLLFHLVPLTLYPPKRTK